MSGTFLDEGLQKLNRIALGIEAQVQLTMAPYTNNVTLTEASVFADFTLSALPGSGPTDLTPGDWDDDTTAGTYSATYPVIELTIAPYVTSSITYYGILVYDSDNGIALWAQALPLPVVIPAAGGNLSVTLEYTDGECP